MTVIELTGIILGSNVVIELVKFLFTKKQLNDDTKKTSAEANQTLMEGELKLTQFYREQVEILIERYAVLEKKLNDKITAHLDCESRINILESKHLELQRQLTLLKTQLNTQ